jgi:class 6 POU domain transcription factor
VVDGINLDEIKEFAKVFKLRRLSLGLTQTQVGQALSVTEGPAYSQSAICRLVHTPRRPASRFRRSADVAHENLLI